MSSIVIAGDTSGSVTIAAPAIAGTTVITLPATTGTLIASGGALGTPSSGTLTSCTGLPMTTGVTGTLPIANGGTGAVSLAAASIATYSGTETLTNKTLGSGTVMPAGSVVQVAYAELLTSGTGSVAIPVDDTIPQNTEGTEILTLTMTPTFASSNLLVQVIANLSENTDVAGPQLSVAAIFRDSTANAIAADCGLGDALAGTANPLNVTNFSFCFRVAATAATATTFKLRVGGETAVSMRWNGFNGTRIFGGVWRTTITVTEIKA